MNKHEPIKQQADIVTISYPTEDKSYDVKVGDMYEAKFARLAWSIPDTRIDFFYQEASPDLEPYFFNGFYDNNDVYVIVYLGWQLEFSQCHNSETMSKTFYKFLNSTTNQILWLSGLDLYGIVESQK